MAEKTADAIHDATLRLMHEQVRAIYRALTGTELPVPSETPRALEEGAPSPDQVAGQFALLDSLARSVPAVAERVPPFSFTPPLDVMESEREILLELGVPGVVRRDIEVTLSENTVIVTGSRTGEPLVDGKAYRHAEMPRGPFRRSVVLAVPTVGQPIVDVENGVIRVRISRAAHKARAQA